MPITSDAFRSALRHFPAGVTIVTIKAGAEQHGLTVSAFTSVSPEPPLIMVCIDRRHSAHALLERPGATFAVNILRADQRALSDRFAYVKDEDRFAVGDWRTAATGAPILADALAWLDCTIYTRQSAGTHTLYIGEVQASHVPEPDVAPLIYWNRDYRALKLDCADEG
ncbi:MAG: FMN reductase (NADH) NtaB [Chloroflexi bacterium ADurb.Bin325]|nr:MAG: FMN reductase (NADH) NtaB [Chloroflexi bacterium ADurb.Bin325]